MIHLIFKSMYPHTRIGVSNLMVEIEKGTIASLVNNVNDLLDEISAN